MIGSINGFEWVILAGVALVVIGPERLPRYARQLGNLIRELREMARGATARVREEVGPEIDDLTSFDPRQYDPRRIIRDVLADDPPTGGSAPRAKAMGTAGAGLAGTTGAADTSATRPGGEPERRARTRDPLPFDDEAT